MIQLLLLGQFAEENETTGWNEFQLRMYDARFGRWLSTDSYGQFASPYVGMGNVPHMGVDPDGGWSWIMAGVGFAAGAGAAVLTGNEDDWWKWGLVGAVVGGLSFNQDHLGATKFNGGFREYGGLRITFNTELYSGIGKGIGSAGKFIGNNPIKENPFVPTLTASSREITSAKRKLPTLAEPKGPSPPKILESKPYHNGLRRQFHGREDDSGSTAVRVYSMYNEARQGGSRNIKIIFISTKPTLETKNWVKRVIDKLIQLGIPRKDIIEELITVEKYPNNAPNDEPAQIHVKGN